ncbi:threonine aldolase family protein [Pseudofulvibacter geojedonensis]|uniref:Threonine aldolase family protein n=1 Tax=Pseudofulvibacter geojedonensis TaxID=1123758 RepID=A0ABW3HYT6_9FLAO
MEINLISDTITRPTEGMLQAMMTAEVGDDVYKLDPTVNELEARLAKMFGMEDALFFPSGTMANQAAIKLHTNYGEQLICDKWAHVYNYEGGGVSFNSGVSCKLIDGDRGMFTANQVIEAINPPDFYHSPLTTLVCVENTTNKGGGACWDIEELKKIQQVCIDHGLKYHLDGARLFNAIVAKNHDPKIFGEMFDTISICLSKGLGAPIGSVLIGSKEYIAKALRVRKVLGGGMRQVGYLAAAALYALDNHIERLAIDHDRAKEVERILLHNDKVVSVETVETNIVIFNLKEEVDIDKYVSNLASKNVFISNMGQGKLRMVFHLDISTEMFENLCDILRKQ